MSTSLNDALKANLQEYISCNAASEEAALASSNGTLFRATREISIARYALEKQAEIYHRLLSSLQELAVSNPNLELLSSLIKTIEERSTRLVNNVNSVVKSLRYAQEIELAHSANSSLDPAQVYAVISQLPVILENILLKVTNDAVLATEVTRYFGEELANLNTIFSGSQNNGNSSNNNLIQGVIEEQYVAMLNSVPRVTYEGEAINVE